MSTQQIPHFLPSIIATSIIAFFSVNTEAADFVVTDPFTFQNALSEAQRNKDDDTIYLLPGTYFVTTPLTYYAPEPPWDEPENHSITIEGAEVDTTILDGSSVSYTLWIDTLNVEEGVSISIRIKNITFKDTKAGVVGIHDALSVSSISGSIFVENCKFINNKGGGAEIGSFTGNITATNNTFNQNGGPALYASTESGIISVTDNSFVENESSGDGGGSYCLTSTGNIILTGNSFQDNHAISHGAGLFVEIMNGGPITIQGNMISNNRAGLNGGGVFVQSFDLELNATIMLIENGFSGNSASYGGGAYLSSQQSQIILSHNSFSQNHAMFEGGGAAAYTKNSGVLFINNIFGENYGLRGGGMYGGTDSGSIIITNNTLTGNSSDNGGGLFAHLKYSVARGDIFNNIVWNNTAEDSGGDLYIDDDGDNDGTGAAINVYHNCYNLFFAASGNHLTAMNNISEDPQTTPDYHLEGGSPCIDTGNNSAPQLPDKDMDFADRVIDGNGDGDATVDIGADEFDPTSPPTTTSSSTTTTTTSLPCASESIYGEHAEQTELLRQFRDKILTQTPEGQEIIRLYYEWSPAIVKAMEEDEEFKEDVKETVDGVLELIDSQLE